MTRPPTPGATGAATSSAETVSHILRRLLTCLTPPDSVTAALDEPVGETGITLGDLIADDHAVDRWRQTDEHEHHRRLWSMVGLLPRCTGSGRWATAHGQPPHPADATPLAPSRETSRVWATTRRRLPALALPRTLYAQVSPA
jgi:hypothetical protein